MGYRVGVDIGGSFTDFAVLDEATGRFDALKVFSRPDAPGAEILAGLAELDARYGVKPEEIAHFTHGTTVGVNTVIQRSGLKLALLTTDGFEDVLELARLKSPDMYDLFSTRPEPLVARANVHGVVERLDASGKEIAPVDSGSVAAALDAALAAGCEGIVVSLLHSHTSGAHERAVREALVAAGCALPVFLSHEVWPIIREYERTTTAVINGYVQPRVAHYLTSMQAALKSVGVGPELLVTRSNGGVMTAEQGKDECVQMVLSGTASGVIGAAFLARAARVDKVISLDIGGTSADVALIRDGEPQYGIGEVIGDFQIHVPSVSVASIGDGGGSIAWLDAQGVLKVGPESAGSTPGPVCYGRGGTRPTITDSFVAAGLLGAGQLGYNAVSVDTEAARAAIAPLGEAVGLSVEQTAEAIRDISVSSMYAGTSAVISRFGINPTEYTMLAFGGAGPMMAAFLARALRMKEVLVPPHPGVLSALGGIVADLRGDFIASFYTALDDSTLAAMRAGLAELEDKAHEWLFGEQGFEGDAAIACFADMRYAGQSFEIGTEIPGRALAEGDAAGIAALFHREHERLFGHSDPEAAVQVINLRLVIRGGTPKPDLPEVAPKAYCPQPAGQARVWLDGAFREAAFYRRVDLRAGAQFEGPAVVMQDDTTTVVPPDCSVAVDGLSNLRISIQ
ncbi:hydantoinase/oxoprolinase family protein [Pukyongiella litopenaei]|uniref:Hydantoinase/oxoprolinase family protein n=1 Tax=Pukyongiella litopenaei TaxID=2605946 RepID=A0A5C2H432_9RHOB|nr:hydantoinase/oxoprolinase family protein [Pukyongiella litopenaei]QEP30646.1 hydantoinase/oxoprolinase family protein [Pukyongiella litopenaei]